MSTETPLTDDEQRLLNRQVMDYAIDRGMWANLMRAFQTILSARLDALHAENRELRQLLKEANSAYAARRAERDALRDALLTLHKPVSGPWSERVCDACSGDDYEVLYPCATASLVLSEADNLDAKLSDKHADVSACSAGERP